MFCGVQLNEAGTRADVLQTVAEINEVYSKIDRLLDSHRVYKVCLSFNYINITYLHYIQSISYSTVYQIIMACLNTVSCTPLAVYDLI